MSEPARDPGLQQERTALAWRRTGLALLVGALVIARLTFDTIGPLSAVPALFTTALAGYVVAQVLRGRRYGRQHEHDARFSVLHDGRLVVAAAAVLGGLALAELLAAVTALAR
ncbi:MAG: DUF202 domain-containing protein [Phycicoccus sp.]|nr:DUF202 domain-containing protein [Phycicoccus sp.]